MLINKLRTFALCFQLRRFGGSGTGTEATWKQPFQNVADVQLCLSGRLGSDGLNDSPAWLPVLQHRLLFLLVVWGRPVRIDEEVDEAMERRMAHTKKAVFDLVRAEVETGPTGEDMGRRARELIESGLGLTEDHSRARMRD
jgi:hypothetical protein